MSRESPLQGSCEIRGHAGSDAQQCRVDVAGDRRGCHPPQASVLPQDQPHQPRLLRLVFTSSLKCYRVLRSS